MKDNITNMLGPNPITNPSMAGTGKGLPNSNKYGTNTSNTPQSAKPSSGRFNFISNLSKLFGFRKTAPNAHNSNNSIEFVKVDAQSPLNLAQAKIGRTFSTKMTTKLDELFNSWLSDVSYTQLISADREKRINELFFMIKNDTFMSMAAQLYSDEATQTDLNGSLIQIECADIRQKERMENLLDQWGITQNRLQAVAYNLATFGDAFWANKVTKNGVVRINPIDIHQIKERLEFNPVQVAADLALQKGYISSINRSAKLQSLFDTLESKENEEFADMFDTRLFGFAMVDDTVLPPWQITHFRLSPDQSEYAPMGKSLFLNCLAPFRQLSATMVLQSLARVMSFPITVYGVNTVEGMDESLQFDKINQIREEYEMIGESGAGTEAFSVNTKIWAPKNLIDIQMHSPDIDINAIGDIQMYQDRVAVGSGIPKGYLVQEWGGYGNSAISLVEQFKPFSRRVFTIQSAILDGLSNLFRLHFAITGEYDYRSPFVLSMKFPNEETSSNRLAAKTTSLNFSTAVLQTISSIIGAINDPLPPEVIQDILTKFSFLSPDDIKKWIKPNPNAKGVEKDGQAPEELGGEGGLGGIEGGGASVGGGAPPPQMEEPPTMGAGASIAGGAPPTMDGGVEAPPTGAGTPPEGIQKPGEEEEDLGLEQNNNNRREKINHNNRSKYLLMEAGIRKLERKKTLLRRYREAGQAINEKVIALFERIDESTINNRHYKYSRIESCNEAMYNIFQKKELVEPSSRLNESDNSSIIEDKETLTWGTIKNMMESTIGQVNDEGIIDQENGGIGDTEDDGDNNPINGML